MSVNKTVVDVEEDTFRIALVLRRRRCQDQNTAVLISHHAGLLGFCFICEVGLVVFYCNT